jgi:hypothetical protein
MREPLDDSKTGLFTVPGAWSGGHYEIATELGGRSDVRAALALDRLWSYRALQGCYLIKDREPTTQEPVNLHEHLEDHWYGIATLPNGQRVPCGSSLCRFDNASDWMLFYLPLASLGNVYPVGGYPFAEDSDKAEWRSELDNWLIGIAKHVFQDFPFHLALVGFEVEFASISSERIHITGIPKERFDGWLWRADSQLDWYPATC